MLRDLVTVVACLALLSQIACGRPLPPRFPTYPGAGSSSTSSEPMACPCSDPSLCERVTAPPRQELMVYSVDFDDYSYYNWSEVTTVALFSGMQNSSIICLAHSHDVRVVYGVSFPIDQLSNTTARNEWVTAQFNMVNSTYTDGINIDIEGNISNPNSPDVDLLTSLIEETSAAFAKLPGTHVTFDAAWSPNCIDGRCYDFVGISENVDFMVQMAYDLRSQIYGACVAGPNAAMPGVAWGVNNFTALGIPANKLVMGHPWYGFDYACIEFSSDYNVCTIPEVPYFGAPCSDAAGYPTPYADILGVLTNPSIETSDPVYAYNNSAVWFNYYDDSYGLTHQFWYDDPLTITTKCDFARSVGMRGSAVWTSDYLPYTTNMTASNDMWNALASCKLPAPPSQAIRLVD